MPAHLTPAVTFDRHFNQTLAGRVPHEGISRLITSSKRAFKDHTVRRGLAFILEHGFMNTAEGREQYRRNRTYW